EQLDQDVADIYNLMIFDDVTYKVIQKDGMNVLKITTTPSWDVNGQIKFAIGFEDNFDGHSDYSVKLEYIKFGLNSYAGEWRSRFTFGQENLLMTELYQPIDPYGYLYVRPAAFYRNKKVYVSPSILINHTIETDLDETFTMQAKEYGGILGVGVNVTKELHLEVGGVVKRVNPSADFLVEDNSSLQYVTLSPQASVYNIYADLEYDDLDNAFFPRSGYRAKLLYRYSDQFKGDESTFSQYLIDVAGAYTFGRHTFSPRLKAGSTFDTENFSNSQDFTSYFTLGGLFNLSGLPTNAVTGNNIALGVLVYRYRLSDDGFFGSLTMPLYAGMSVESGSAWYSSDLLLNGTDSFSTDRLLYSGSAYIAADTILGPFYLGVGTTEFDYYSFYFSLGQSF
ncbi:MAG: BamA/TamA family outer membrane protein, partial [Sulfurimonadaceae bacterium]